MKAENNPSCNMFGGNSTPLSERRPPFHILNVRKYPHSFPSPGSFFM